MRDEILNYFRTTRRTDLLVIALVMLFFGGALVLDRVSSGVHLVLLVLGVHAWWKSGGWQALSRSEQFMLAGFAAWFVVGVISYYLGVGGELGMKILGRDLRFLLAVPVYFILKQVGLTVTHLRIAFALGGIAVGAVAAAQYFSADTVVVRASGRTISILFGHLCVALAMVNLALTIVSRGHWRWLSLVGAVSAIVAAGFSITRGAVVVIMVVTLLLVLVKLRRGFSRVETVISILLVVAIVSGMHLRETGLDHYVRGINEAMQVTVRVMARTDVPVERSLPYCLTDPALLKTLSKAFYFGGSGKTEMSHEPLDMPWTGGAVQCQSGSRLVFENISPRRRTWIYLPLRNVPLNSKVNASLLIRGHGAVGLSGWSPEDRIRIDSSAVRRIDLDTMATGDNQVLIVLEPGQRIELIPLQIFRSEYAFPGAETSFGARLYMWRDAWHMFMTDPMFGKGVGGFAATIKQQAADGRSPTAISDFDHAHNEILNTLAERGILGLLALFLIYAAPFWLFYWRRDVVGLAGMAFVVSIFLSGLTETIFNHSLGITFYALTVLVLAAARPFTEPSATPSR